jgi:hypothetical protein
VKPVAVALLALAVLAAPLVVEAQSPYPCSTFSGRTSRSRTAITLSRFGRSSTRVSAGSTRP